MNDLDQIKDWYFEEGINTPNNTELIQRIECLKQNMVLMQQERNMRKVFLILITDDLLRLSNGVFADTNQPYLVKLEQNIGEKYFKLKEELKRLF